MTLLRCREFVDDYSFGERINITRRVNFNPEYEVQLNAFCYASEKAYAAALYSRIKISSGEIFTHLLDAKTKVPPVKVQILRCLELCGATLLPKMVHSLLTELNFTNSKAFY